MRSKVWGLFGVLLSLSLLAAACSSSSSNEGGGGTMTIGSDQANNKGSATVSGKSSFDIEADNDGNTFYFKPTVLSGTAGQTLNLTVKNKGTTLHNFSLTTDTNGGTDIQQDGEQVVSVTFPQSGLLEFFCKYHRSRGMAGELSVSG